MAASSSFKSYAQQPRTLTEEQGFAGGMLYSDNNIDAAHLKTLVNVEYDETTGYLRSRPEWVRCPLQNADGTDYSMDLGSSCTDAEVCGVYTIAPSCLNWGTQYDSTVVPVDKLQAATSEEAGLLYLYSKKTSCVSTAAEFIDQRILVGATFVTGSGEQQVAHTVTLAHVWGSNTQPVLVSRDRVHGLLYDNTVYFQHQLYQGLSTQVDRQQALLGFVLLHDKSSTTDRYVLGVKDTETQVNSIGLMDAASTGFNLFRNEDAYIYHSTNDTSLNVNDSYIEGVYLSYILTKSNGHYTEPTRVYARPRLGCTYNINIVATLGTSGVVKGNPTPTQDHVYGNRMVGLYRLKANGDAASEVVPPYRGTQAGVAKTSDWEELLVYKDGYENAAATTASYVLGDTTATDYYDHQRYQVRFTQKNTMFKVVVWGLPWLPADKTTVDAVEITSYTFNYTAVAAGEYAIKSYKISDSWQRCLWGTRLVLWDTPGYPNTIFISDADNLTYVSDQHGVCLFDTDVYRCIPYQSSLLVFTKTKLYQVTANADGTYSQKVLQNTLQQTLEDGFYSLSLKNMVFFKMLDYFYMVVPKSQSLTGELTIAPVYKAVSLFLQNPQKAIEQIICQMYPGESIIHQYTGLPVNTALHTVTYCKLTTVYAEGDIVHCLYNCAAEGAVRKMCFQTFLDYNTNLRNWCLRIVQCDLTYVDALGSTVPATTAYYYNAGTDNRPCYLRIPTGTDITGQHVYRFYTEAGTTPTFPVYMGTTFGNLPQFAWWASQGLTHPVYTYQFDPTVIGTESFRCFLDTGYRTLATSYKKRFRELQLQLYTADEKIRQFGSAFYLDGEARKSYTNLSKAYVYDRPYEYSLAPVYEDNTYVNGNNPPVLESGMLALGSTQIALDDWELDFSHFQKNAPTTVRIPVSGKGYNPRFVVLIRDPRALQINGINWVYRMMSGR